MGNSAPTSLRSLLNSGLLAAIVAILVLDFNGYRWLMPVDEGQWLYYSDQLLQGRLLYKDFWYQFGPAVLYGLAGAMVLAGKTLATERIFFWLLNVAGMASLYGFSTVLSRRATPRLVLCLVALLNSLTCRLTMTNPAFLFRQCFNLLPLLILFQSERGTRKGNRSALRAGVLSMLCVLVSQETGAFSFVAGVVFILVRGMNAGSTRDWLHPLGTFVGGFLLALGVWSAFCLSQGNLQDYFLISFGEVFYMAADYQSAPFPGLSTLIGVGGVGSLAAYYHFGLTYVPVLTAALAGTWLLAQGRWDARALSLCSYGICSFSILLGRSDIYHATFAALPLFLLATYGFDKALSLGETRHLRAFIGTIVLICGLIIVSNASNLRKLASKSRFAKTIEYTESLPHLGSALIPEWQHEVIRFAKRAVEENTDVNQAFFAILHAPHLYFFVDRPAKTRFATPIFANTKSAKKEIFDELRMQEYEFLVYESRQFPDINYDYYFEEILEYTKRHYGLHSEIPHRVQILRRKQ